MKLGLVLFGLVACGDPEVLDSDDEGYETYACGWEKRDPGDLVSTGKEEGDVLRNMLFSDQCGETLRVWDLYHQYFLLYFVSWECTDCRAEASGFVAEQATYREEGLPFTFLVVLYAGEDDSQPPDPDDFEDATMAPDYAAAIGVDKEFPVTADYTGELVDNVPWEGSDPGKCVVSREMVILHCWTSIYNEEGMDAIREDYAAAR